MQRLKGTARFPIAVFVGLVGAGCARYFSQAGRQAEAIRMAAPTRLTGARAVVVGGTSGIGHGVAAALARAGATVTIVGRDAERGASVVKELNAIGGAGHEFVACDAALLSNAKVFATNFAAAHDRLDVLVLTQGIATMAGRTETSEGIDKKLALHYYGRAAFAVNLLPLLRRSSLPGGASVLSVLSAGVHAPYAGWSTDPELRTSFSLKNAADAAGLYNDCAWDALSRAPENADVTWVHAAPGVVASRWGQTDMPAPVAFLLRLALPLIGTSIYACGEHMVSPLLRPRTAAESGSGRAGFVLIGARGQPAAPTRVQEEARESVWAHTEAVLRRVGAWPQ